MDAKTDLSALMRTKGKQIGDPPQGGGASSIPPPAWKWKTRLLLPGMVIVAAAALLGYSAREALTPALEVQAVPVLVRQVVPGEAGGSAGQVDGGGGGGGGAVQAPGWVEPDPFSISVPALADGVVREVLVLEGDHVKAGQVVAHLIDEDARLALAAAEAQVAEHRAALDLAQVELHAAQRQWDHPVERRRAVAAAEALAREAHAELAMLELQVAAEAARAQEARDEHARLLRLRDSLAGSEAELSRWEQRARAAQSVLAAAQARRAVLEAQLARHEAEASAARQSLELRIEERRALDAAQAALLRARAALARAEVNRDEAQLRLARMQITTPAAGIVLARLIEPGMRLTTGSDDPTGSLALRLYDPARLQVRVDIPLADAQRIRVGQEAQLVTEGLPDRTFRGRVSRLVHEANIQKNTVQVKVALIESGDATAGLKPEMLMRVRFHGPSGPGAGSAGGEAQAAPAGYALLVPRTAVTPGAAGASQVWIVDQARQAAAVRHIRLGAEASDGWVQILEGLQPGDRVIVQPSAALRPGTRVRIAQAAGGAEWR
jgi:HlyD family secretion protein